MRLSTLTASWVHDTRDNVLDAAGIRTTSSTSSPYWIGSNFSFAQLVSQTAHYQNIGKGIIWANSLRIGLQQPLDGSEVPVSSSFFAEQQLNALAAAFRWMAPARNARSRFAASPATWRRAPKSPFPTAATSC